MATTTVISIKYTLLSMIPVAFYVLWYVTFAYDGLLVHFKREVLPSGDLPSTPGVRWKEHYTGIHSVDRVFTAWALFYWTLASWQ